MNNLKFIISILIITLTLSAFADGFNEESKSLGILRGQVIDAKTGEAIIGCQVYIEDTKTGAVTDLDGKFSIQLPPGNYNIRISYISYQTLELNDITVKPGDVVILDNIKLMESSYSLEAVTVQAEAVRNTEHAVTAMKRKSTSLIDGISAAKFKKIGDSDAASAMKRVTGVSVVGGKYIYVRGLGDRYSKTILNGLDVPGLDPDRNSLQMDIFPTNIIDNIIVHKSFSAELPASFTGGIVDIHTKDFPDKKQSSISVGLGYNPNFHFNSNYLTYEGGKTDWLGFDDGTRNIPASQNVPTFVDAIVNPNGEDGIRYKEILSNFNPTMGSMKQNSFMDFSIGADFANQKKLEKLTLGYSFAMSYKNSTDFYEDAVFAKYGMSSDKSINELQQREYQVGDYGVNNVLLSGLAGIAIKTLKSKIKFNILHLQNGEKKAALFDYTNRDKGAEFDAVQHNLEYSQKSLTNILIDGKHVLDNSKWTIEWKVSPTYSSIKDPDMRFLRYEKLGTNSYGISSEVGFPERIWRNLSEINLASLVNFTREFKYNSNKAYFKFGGGYVYKQRSFDVKTFAINPRNIPITGNPDELFNKDNLWPYNNSPYSGTSFEANFVPTNPNNFVSNNSNASIYSSIEVNPFERLRTIVGLRIESFNQYYTGQDQLGSNVLENDLVLENIDFFPTINMIYKLTEKQNLRFAYSKTIARPSFKELSYAEIYDPISGTTFVGGLFRDADDFKDVVYWDGNLVSTDIHNMDLRWEFYNKLGNSISVAAFYKKFNNPIEIVQYSIQSGSFQPRNVGDATVIGGEIEANQYLDFISKKLQEFSINANFTLVESRVELSNIEYQSRVENAREGQTIDKYRDMANQAPYIINAGISYRANNKSKLQGFEAALFYNVQGPTLQFVGIVDRPDIYEEDFHSLNMNLNYKFGINDKMKIGFKVSNILNDKKASYYDSFGANPMYFRSLYMGRTTSLSFSYSFN